MHEYTQTPDNIQRMISRATKIFFEDLEYLIDHFSEDFEIDTSEGTDEGAFIYFKRGEWEHCLEVSE